MLQRKRFKAIDINFSNPSQEDKENLRDMGYYLNFSPQFVLHRNLDKGKIREYVSGFCNNVANGRAFEPLLKHLGKYLEPKDFAVLRLVCKPGF